VRRGWIDRRRRSIAPLAAIALVAVASIAPADDWPQHLGPHRDGVSAEPAPEAWPAAGPPILWKRPVGQSFAAPVVAGDQVFVFHRYNDEVLLDCLRVADGRTVWSYRAPTAYRDDFGFSEGPRAAPVVTKDRIYLFGAEGDLVALDRANGARRWSVPTAERFGVDKGFFGAASSPLVVGDRLYLNVGGERNHGLVAFDTANGNPVWAAAADAASYSSAVETTFAGQAAILFFTRGGIVLAAADDGAILARHPWRSRSNSSVNAATPLVLGDRIFASASYGTGAVLLDTAGGALRPVWASDDALSNHYATSVSYQGLLFGFHGRQEYGPSLRCIDASTGAIEWSIDRFGAGSILRVSDRLLVLHGRASVPRAGDRERLRAHRRGAYPGADRARSPRLRQWRALRAQREGAGRRPSALRARLRTAGTMLAYDSLCAFTRDGGSHGKEKGHQQSPADRHRQRPALRAS
jgi:outer membrane protein assembly factor BamB